MMRRNRIRGALAAAVTAALVGMSTAQAEPGTSGSAPPPPPIVVEAPSCQTFNTPPFEGTPSVTWTREIGRVLTAILDGGATVVGFDIVFPTSIEQSAVPFGDETLGARLRGFDRDYLRALALGARAGKVVLGEVQHQQAPVLPSPGQRACGRLRP